MMNNETKKNGKRLPKKYWVLLICVSLAFVFATTFFITTCYVGLDSTINYINAFDYDYIQNENIVVTKFKEENYAVINNKTNRPLKILQLTDLHIGCGYLSISYDKKLVNEIFNCVSIVNPDIIIVTGDALSPIYTTSGTKNNYYQIDALIALLEKLGRPYTFCFGNHDASGIASKEVISNKLESAPKSFFLKGESDVTGEGNYYVKIQENGVLTQSLILMDSGARASDFKYAGIDKKQVLWYEKTIKKLKEEKSDIKNLTFIHVPIPEYNAFYDKWKSGDENYTLLNGEKCERTSAGKQSGFYDKMKELDSTKWVFCGHDHTNNFSIKENSTGITLSYGMSMDFTTYPVLKYKTHQRGGKVIYLDGENVDLKLAPQDKKYQEVDFI